MLNFFFQIKSDHELLRPFYNSVEECYTMDGAKSLPLHVKKDPRSIFEAITQVDFDNLSIREVQEK